MNRTIAISAITAITAIVLLCAGCADSGGPATDPTAPASGTSPSATSDGDCARATVDGTTKEAQVQQIATEIYDSLACGTGTPLADQLAAAAKGAQSQMRAAGIQSKFTSVGGGSSLHLTRGSGGCQIMVVDSVESKGLTCLDL